MLKFTRQRSSSTERGGTGIQTPPRPVQQQQFRKTNTRDFSPARQRQKDMTNSLERRPKNKLVTRRQLIFEENGFVSPRDISASRKVENNEISSTLPRRMSRIPIPSELSSPSSVSPSPKIPARKPVTVIPTAQSSDAKESAKFAPLTPTLEKLSSPHVTEGVKIPPQPTKSALKYSTKYDFHRAVERLVEKLDLQLLDTSSESGYGSADDHDGKSPPPLPPSSSNTQQIPPPPPPRRPVNKRRVHFDSYVLLLQGLRERNVELVQRHVREVCREALLTDEITTELMKLVIQNEEILVTELLNGGCDPNHVDAAGLTPLHLAAAFGQLNLVKKLLDSGAAVFSRAHSSGKTASELCNNYLSVRSYLRCMEECLGVANGGVVFAARPYQTSRADELNLSQGERLQVVRKGDYAGSSWWWCRHPESAREGYVLRDLLSLRRATV